MHQHISNISKICVSPLGLLLNGRRQEKFHVAHFLFFSLMKKYLIILLDNFEGEMSI